VRLTARAKIFRLWTANSSDRDFRDDQWSSVALASNVTQVIANVAAPKEGFRAYLIEAELTASTGHNFKLSTEARVIPDGPPPSPREAPEPKP
jgi:PhoPQ-activated pathogenicity-related protein